MSPSHTQRQHVIRAWIQSAHGPGVEDWDLSIIREALGAVANRKQELVHALLCNTHLSTPAYAWLIKCIDNGQITLSAHDNGQQPQQDMLATIVSDLGPKIAKVDTILSCLPDKMPPELASRTLTRRALARCLWTTYLQTDINTFWRNCELACHGDLFEIVAYMLQKPPPVASSDHITALVHIYASSLPPTTARFPVSAAVMTDLCCKYEGIRDWYLDCISRDAKSDALMERVMCLKERREITSFVYDKLGRDTVAIRLFVLKALQL
ncbi:hypothetical protein SeMB42_g02165 [Synchytrium endobioticum]|uniref:Uncharacterized protein n=1 Tax=Synchytrium endobioticum TaxID=286115 RepID=A0A507DGM4_9FUNG|nr:hypothetical protein SeMB42_g02165 [Synchytrium endobioticum]